MSIATQIARLQTLRNRLRTKILGLGLDTDPQLDLEDCVGIVEGIGGTQNITTTGTYDVAGKQYARVSDANLTPKNIVKNVSILGVVGTASATPQPVNLEARTMFYGGPNPPSIVYPSQGYDGLSSVTPELTDATRVLTAGNIKNGVTIMGVTGNYVTPTEAKAPTLADLKTAGITNNSVNIVPSSGKHLSQVTIPRITKDDGTPIQSSDIASGSSILGIHGSVDRYATLELASERVSSGSDATGYLLLFELPDAITNLSQIIEISAIIGGELYQNEYYTTETVSIVTNFIVFNNMKLILTCLGCNLPVIGSGNVDVTHFTYNNVHPLSIITLSQTPNKRFLQVNTQGITTRPFSYRDSSGSNIYYAYVRYAIDSD